MEPLLPQGRQGKHAAVLRATRQPTLGPVLKQCGDDIAREKRDAQQQRSETMILRPVARSRSTRVREFPADQADAIGQSMVAPGSRWGVIESAFSDSPMK